MKKIISLVLTLLIAASVSVTAFAGENMKQQKSASCKATAVAEMISRATGRDYRESDFYANASTGSCVNINGRKYGSFTAEYKTDYSGTTKSQQLAKINDSLSRNVPIVVQVSPGNPHHWVTILSKSGSSYLIVDPATGKQIVLSSKYTLGAHGDYGYVCLNGASLSGSNNNGGSTNSSGYYPKYTGSSSSIVTALGAVGVDSSYSNRAKIAAANGISNYSGTAAQNTQMLNLLKNGRLKKVGSSSSTSSSTQYYPKYTGSSSSIVTALGAVGVDSSYSNRAKIAAANGISNYSGTAAQNTQMLNLLKNGRLKKY